MYIGHMILLMAPFFATGILINADDWGKNMDNKKRPFLETKDIYKSFGHVQALRGVSMNAYEGEVLAIVGDNGAGKSTLIKILSGVLHPDSGLVRIDDKEYQDLTPRKAIEAGVSTVYQDLALGNTMDVASNLFLGSELTKYGFLKKKKMNEEARKLLNSLDIQIPDVTVPVGNLSGGQRQGVAVARLVHNGGKLLIFDEPTAAMGLNESNAVLKLITKLAGEGFTVIIISHNLPHVFYISDRICVMRQGKVIKELKTQDTTMDEVVSMITGAITTD
ncbi:ATP-binding cassette domain-containing protein [Blautia obeum]|uniref:ATP-binding cassette domain-containing protein n=1 Tax=Blautia obeum TaxID=40520 RepID=UPI003D02A873